MKFNIIYKVDKYSIKSDLACLSLTPPYDILLPGINLAGASKY